MFYPKIISLFNFFYFNYISYTVNPLFYSYFELVSFYMIIPQYQNGIETYSTFNFLRRVLLYRVLNFQIALNLRNYFRIQQSVNKTLKGIEAMNMIKKGQIKNLNILINYLE